MKQQVGFEPGTTCIEYTVILISWPHVTLYVLVCEVDRCHLLFSLHEVGLVLSDGLQQLQGLVSISSGQSQVGVGYGDPEREGGKKKGGSLILKLRLRCWSTGTNPHNQQCSLYLNYTHPSTILETSFFF